MAWDIIAGTCPFVSAIDASAKHRKFLGTQVESRGLSWRGISHRCSDLAPSYLGRAERRFQVANILRDNTRISSLGPKFHGPTAAYGYNHP